jgi:hypothetical protein
VTGNPFSFSWGLKMKATITYITQEGIVLCARYNLLIEQQFQLFGECIHALGAQGVEYDIKEWLPDFPE